MLITHIFWLIEVLSKLLVMPLTTTVTGTETTKITTKVSNK